MDLRDGLIFIWELSFYVISFLLGFLISNSFQNGRKAAEAFSKHYPYFASCSTFSLLFLHQVRLITRLYRVSLSHSVRDRFIPQPSLYRYFMQKTNWFHHHQYKHLLIVLLPWGPTHFLKSFSIYFNMDVVSIRYKCSAPNLFRSTNFWLALASKTLNSLYLQSLFYGSRNWATT